MGIKKLPYYIYTYNFLILYTHIQIIRKKNRKNLHVNMVSKTYQLRYNNNIYVLKNC